MLLKRTLPTGITDFISGEARTVRDEESLKRLALYMYGKYMWELKPFEEPIEISAEHWRKAFGTHYLRYLKRFKAAGIIKVVQRDDGREFYSPPPDGSDRQGLCKRYFFAPEAIFTEPATVEYDERLKKRFEGEYTIRETVKLLSKIKLTVSYRQIKPYVEALVTPEYIRERLKIGQEIPPGYYYYSYTDQEGRVTFSSQKARGRDDLLATVERQGLDLILYRDKCYLTKKGGFIKRRIYQARAAYIDSLQRLKDIRKRPNIICSRNSTNRRLDTNLTNFKSELLSLVRLDGERLVSIDLSNSQFTIMAHALEECIEYLSHLDRKHFKEIPNILGKYRTRKQLFQGIIGERVKGEQEGIVINYRERIIGVTVTNFLNKTDDKTLTTASLPSDLREFINLTKNGLFYDHLAELMSTDEQRKVTREEAKKAMFLTAFSAHRYNPKPKQLLAQHYPNLVTFMNEFKKAMISHYKGEGIGAREARRQGNASLSVMLQNIESMIFIDNILTKLLSSGYRVFSKHDSILCKESDQLAVEAIIRAELNQYFGAGEYRLKTEKH